MSFCPFLSALVPKRFVSGSLPLGSLIWFLQPDVRLVIHWGLAKTIHGTLRSQYYFCNRRVIFLQILAGYYQQTRRAGRDGSVFLISKLPKRFNIVFAIQAAFASDPVLESRGCGHAKYHALLYSHPHKTHTSIKPRNHSHPHISHTLTAV